jgi:hypothetical protein
MSEDARVSAEAITTCPHCDRETPTIRGLCPHCGYAKQGSGPRPAVAQKPRRFFWDDLDDLIRIAIWCIPGVAFVAVAVITESGLLIGLGIAALLLALVLRVLIDEWL